MRKTSSSIYYFLLVLEFYSLHKLLVHLFFQLIFWGRDLLAASQVSLPWQSCTAPCQGAGLGVAFVPRGLSMLL